MVRNALLSLFVLVLAAAGGPAGAAEKLQVTDVTVGSGAEAGPDSRVTVHYTGWLMDGTEFDSSRNRNKPITFDLGAHRVIQGWDRGIVGMREGGTRELVIPPHLAYGPQGAGGVIPPNATLKFNVELVKVAAPAFTTVDNETVKALLAQGVPIVDVRRPEEWAQTGVIEGAHKITAFDGRGKFVRDFPKQFAEVVGQDSPVLLICRTGSRTRALSQMLSEHAGYTRIYNVRDGITKWISDGNPVVKE
ncbi:MAG: FKBP-type peptidyl-prolyl cis-trans isomerase [Rhodobacterales bacterium]|nr:FKBP-type peptidyl-prolyl cis-trans isomerase [Rhodobacterales bacterium]